MVSSRVVPRARSENRLKKKETDILDAENPIFSGADEGITVLKEWQKGSSSHPHQAQGQ